MTISLNPLRSGDGFQTGHRQFERVTCPVSSRRQIGAPGFAAISPAKPSFASLAPTLTRTAPLIVAGADKQ